VGTSPTSPFNGRFSHWLSVKSEPASGWDTELRLSGVSSRHRARTKTKIKEKRAGPAPGAEVCEFREARVAPKVLPSTTAIQLVMGYSSTCSEREDSRFSTLLESELCRLLDGQASSLLRFGCCAGRRGSAVFGTMDCDLPERNVARNWAFGRSAGSQHASKFTERHGNAKEPWPSWGKSCGCDATGAPIPARPARNGSPFVTWMESIEEDKVSYSCDFTASLNS
jgi:hypothetical protein